MPVKFVFLVLPQLHLLDLAGPEQVFYAAIGEGADFELQHCGLPGVAHTSAGLALGKLTAYPKVTFNPGDYLIIPGASTSYLLSKEFRANDKLFAWIRKAQQSGVNIGSICTGAYVLAVCGLLNNRACTTHWQLTEDLQQRFPKLDVHENVLFVKQDNIYTSAGIVSGIDMALAILEDMKGAYFAHKIARELVIYNRRQAHHSQHSNPLSYRNHIHAGIHRTQDWLHENLDKKPLLNKLAAIANMSTRNFTRIFKKETGITVNEYLTNLRREKLLQLQANPDVSQQQMAQSCGLKSERQVRRILQHA